MPEPEAPPADGVVVEINGTEIVARKGELLIDAAERTGTYIPRFCYHERMRPVGMCRMCIVEVDTGRGPALQPSCMLECTPGMKVDTESELTKKVQDGVLEFLLINHPLDCPVCDKGGECPLQDQTMAYGPGESPLRRGEAAQGEADPDQRPRAARPGALHPLRPLHPLRQGGGRRPADPLHPPGQQHRGQHLPRRALRLVLQRQHRADLPGGRAHRRAYRFKARPWDLETTESTCTQCSVGCRISIDSSRDQVLRFAGVDVDPVNWGWLCDKGRFAHEAVTTEDRLAEPLVRQGDDLVAARWADALEPGRRRPAAAPRRSRSASSVAPASPTRTPTPGPSWPRACSAPTTSTPSSATGSRPRSCSACPAPPSTRSAPPAAPCSCSAPTPRRSCRSCSCGSATPRSTTASPSSRSRPAAPG